MPAEAKISDEAVETRTGKSWAQWFRILDRWGAAKKGHKAAAAWLRDERELPPWWAQMVTVRYERERGLRERHERTDGFRISVSRGVPVAPPRAFDALTKPGDLSRWFTRGARANLEPGGSYSNREGDRGRFLAVTRPRRVRMTWENETHAPGTVVEFEITAASAGKSRVEVTHSRLATKRDAEKMKEAWSWALDSLRSYLETGKPIPVESWEADRTKKPAARASKARPKTAKAKKRKVARPATKKRTAARPAVKKRIRASA